MVSTINFDSSAGWGSTIQGIFGKTTDSVDFFADSVTTNNPMSKSKVIAICTIGFIVGVAALAVSFAALAVLFSCPVVGPFLAAAAVGSILIGVTSSSAALIAIGAVFGALTLTGFVFGSAAANALRREYKLPTLS